VRRREFITWVVGAAASWPLIGSAQETRRIYRLAILTGGRRDAPQFVAFFDELGRLGFFEGKNLTLVPGGFNVSYDQLAAQAAEMIKAAPDVIFTPGGVHTRAAQTVTQTVPIVGGSDDMLTDGLVVSLARPSGNTTGISMLSPELDSKRQDILIEAVPGVHRMAALADSNLRSPHLQMLHDAARAHGVVLSIFFASKPEEIAPAINEAKASGAEALNVLATPLFVENRRIVFEHVAALRLPAIYQWPEMAKQGGLLAYGPPVTELYRQRARMIVKIFRGAKPADMPVEQPTRFELVINLKTAKVLGLEVPPTLLARADEVIE
jgi:putative tryptophan/tyrosine transport system substrate-binding protein